MSGKKRGCEEAQFVYRVMTFEPRNKQEPMTRSEQLPCLVSWRFHKTVYFENDFGAKLEYLLGSHKPLRKTKRPENDV